MAREKTGEGGVHGAATQEEEATLGQRSEGGRRSGGPRGLKGRTGQLAAGPIGLKVEGKFVSE
jgi:hypothetical protein